MVPGTRNQFFRLLVRGNIRTFNVPGEMGMDFSQVEISHVRRYQNLLVNEYI